MFVNIASYKFVALDDLPEMRKHLLLLTRNLALKGSILISTEGINMFLAGTRESIDAFFADLRTRPEFEDITIKESLSDEQPFNRMLVKIKQEIIAFGIDGIEPGKRTSPKLEAKELKRWLDEGRPLKLLDVRNEYEIKLGTFDGAEKLGIDHFRDFPEAVDRWETEDRETPVVMFCTGGIRCEKAGPLMEQKGFKNIYQLDGGILKYFEECGGEHYDGDCFVFDQRVAVDSQLQETETAQCYACQLPLTAEEQQSDKYVPGVSCPHCYLTPDESLSRTLEERNAAIQELVNPLPGCTSYINKRPIHIPAAADGKRFIDHLTSTFVFVEPDAWQERFDLELLLLDGKPATPDTIVESGQRFEHWFPDTVEPPVNGDIRILHEDESLVVVNKPAPMPMHPCGRFNKNSLTSILAELYYPQQLRLAHRLDSNTSGVAIFCRKKQAASKVQPQFAKAGVRKCYRCRIHGHPAKDEFECQAEISPRTRPAGARFIEAGGLTAHTEFTVFERCADGTSLIEARPITGRTNQIRIHLWHLGFPIVGDPMYLPNQEIKPKQTLSLDDPPLCLHAYSIEFTHPTSEQRVTYSAPVPAWYSE
jgi:RluA family pseudouridine synthase